MYIYFDKQGVVKEIVQADKVRLGDAESNKFYIYFEEDNNIGVDILIERPNGTKTPEIPINLNVEIKEIPYNKNQDLKFFQDYKPYKFYTYTLTSDDIQGQKGLFLATIRAFQDAHNVILAEGLITFNVENNVIKEDHYITQSQYDHLMSLIARYINLNMVVDITYSNYSMVVSYRDKTSKTFDFSQIRINKENIESLTQRVTANENKLVQHENKLTEHTQKLNQHDTSIQALEERASGIEEVNRQQQVELDQHQGLITLIQQDIATIQGRLDVIENNVNVNNALLNDHETRLDNIENSKGQPNGLATLDANGLVNSSQLPAYVDDIISGQLLNNTQFLSTDGITYDGSTPNVSSHIYVDINTNLQYRWSGVEFVVISKSLALGETSATAYPGDKGKENRQAIDTINEIIRGIINGTTKVGDSKKLGGVEADLYAKKSDLPLPYELQLASETMLGGIKARPRNPKVDFVEITVDPITQKAYSSEGLSLALGTDYDPNAPIIRTIKVIDKATGQEDIYTIPPYLSLLLASPTEIGGIKADPATSQDLQPVRLGGDGKLYTSKGGYILPIATHSILGGVLAQAKTSEQTEAVGVDANGNLFTKAIPTLPKPYELPIATETMLGGIKARPKTPNDTERIAVDGDGQLWMAPGGYNLPQATASALGGIKAKSKMPLDNKEVHIDTDGTLWVESGQYVLPIATEKTLGGILAMDINPKLDVQPVKIDHSTGYAYTQADATMIFSDTEYPNANLLKGIGILDKNTGLIDYYNFSSGGGGGVATNITPNVQEPSTVDLDNLKINEVVYNIPKIPQLAIRLSNVETEGATPLKTLKIGSDVWALGETKPVVVPIVNTSNTTYMKHNTCATICDYDINVNIREVISNKENSKTIYKLELNKLNGVADDILYRIGNIVMDKTDNTQVGDILLRNTNVKTSFKNVIAYAQKKLLTGDTEIMPNVFATIYAQSISVDSYELYVEVDTTISAEVLLDISFTISLHD